MNSAKLKVLLVDDHAIVREGLRSLIVAESDMEVIGQAENGRTALRLVGELGPDVVIMDIAMPDLNGMEATRQVVRAHPEVKVIALSMHADKRFVSGMLEAGAAGYLLKDSAFEELARAVRAVHSGQTYISPAVAGLVVEGYLGTGSESGRPAARLSPREREVLQLVAEGVNTKQIAARLGVSVKTIETHRRQVMEKLEVRSVAELTKYAIREGLTSVDD
jgi:DNA-binding NarL/FixJ family response regulator